jgi:threonine/homoserine/homoserine lactone efflux protein
MELWLPLALFAFVSSITPGPNNVMLSASGVVFGFKRTIPHLFGVWVGFALLLASCGGGVGMLIERLPALDGALKLIGSAYLLYLAWTMRAAFEPRGKDGSGRPLRFHEAVAFQFVNPKAWVMAITAVAVFGPNLEPRWLAIASVCLVFSIVNLPCIASWAVLGASLKPWLASERRRKLLGGSVALLMAYSVIAVWL